MAALGAPGLRDAARSLLQSTTLGAYLATRPPSHVAVLEEKASVGDALRTLARHKILSAPVVSNVNGDVVGFFSGADALSAFTRGVQPSLLRDNSGQSAASRADELASAGAEFCAMTLRAVPFGGDGVLAYTARAASTSLHDVVTPGFLSDARCNHRLAVWDLDGVDEAGEAAMRVTAVVSQSDVVRRVRAFRVICALLRACCLFASYCLLIASYMLFQCCEQVPAQAR